MKRLRNPQVRLALVGAVVGLAVASAFSLLMALGVESLTALQLTAADLVFLREGGPMLGARPVRGDIVIVQDDERTFEELGGPDRPGEDLKLYTSLLERGALAVGDTRVVFVPAPGVEEVLDGMVALKRRGMVFRDVWVTDEAWLTEEKKAYLSRFAHNFFRYDAGYDAAQSVRFYPIVGRTTTEGVRETMALLLARAALGLELEADPTKAATLGAYRLAPDFSFPLVYRRSREAPTIIAPASLWINYAGPPGSFPSVSYVDALRGRVPEGFFQGKVVIVSFITMETVPTPASATRRASTGEVVASVVQSLLERKFLQPQAPAQAIPAVFLLSLASGVLFAQLRLLWSASLLVTLLLLYTGYATWLYRSGTVPDMLFAPAAAVVTMVAMGAYRYGTEERARRRIMGMFSRYVPKAVAEELVRRPEREALALGGERREVTVLFADIRGFTSFSEGRSPEEVLSRLNTLLKIMVGCVFRHQGTVDKYIGDAIMVLFNAPLDQQDHALRAVKTALEMQQAMAGQGEELAFGIGIHTGEAVVGNVGTPERMEYTAIGSTVNIASRLCDTAGRGEVIVSEQVYRRIEEWAQAQQRAPIRVKGIAQELETYRVLGWQSQEPQEGKA